MTDTYKTFKEFMEEEHMAIHPDVLDDDLPDHFDNWVADLQADEWLEYGEKHAEATLQSLRTTV